MRVISDTKVPIKIWASILEDEAEQQVRKVASLPFIHSHVALMPDAHAGKGSTIGTVIATKGAIIPSCVGVDIGCGMAAYKLPFKVDVLDGKLAELRHSIERAIPTGRFGHRREEVPNSRTEALLNLGKCSTEMNTKIIEQCGTLGGGNHFIEICTDTEGNAWVMLHSGSRNIGKTLAEVHIAKAKGLMKQYFIDLPDPDLAFLAQGTPEFKAYIDDLHWGQSYAALNRQVMMELVIGRIMRMFPGQGHICCEKVINCHHNYTQMENHYGANVWVTRKGAVSAKSGELGIIPGSMGAKSFIVRGLGNPESFSSCSHGAGRKMSRTKARATFTTDDLAQQTSGVECRKDADVIDEIPGAYKDIEQVMNDQADLVEKVAELKQLICVKG